MKLRRTRSTGGMSFRSFKIWLLLWVSALALAAPMQATPSIVYVVRHAERADSNGVAEKDPALSAAGKARARALAGLLQDAKITALYATEFRRTQDTARPLADALKIPITVIPATETAALMEKLKGASGNALIVGHSNTVPAIIKALGVSEPVTLGESEYDNLFLVVTEPSPRLVRLHFR